jgi:erythromycin esterase
MVLRAICASVGLVTTAHAQNALLNLGFERRTSMGRPDGWNPAGSGYTFAIDSMTPLEGRYSLRSQWTGPGQRTQNAFVVASTVFPISSVAGRALRLSGYIRTESVSEGYAGFWMRVDRAPGEMLLLENMSTRGARGTTPWTRFEIELPVDSGASTVIFGLLHPGNGTAWFDSLSVNVIGPPRPRTVASAPPFTPTPRVPEDSTRLLTDAELAVSRDSARESSAPAPWSDWVRRNARPIRSLVATNFADLRFIAPLLAGKRIVQLGESGHGVAEFNLAKVRLIKYLHEELGYDVIAFESSLFECDRAQRAVATLSAQQLMQSCIFGVWHADETTPLFEYIKQTQSTARPLKLTGFDSQTSSPRASARPAFFRDVIARVDAARAAEVYRRDSTYLALARTNRTGDSSAVAKEVAFYDSLATWLRAHERDLATKLPDDAMAPKLARQTALSMVAFTRQRAAEARTGTVIRDRAMADNLDFLLAERYPKDKVIVWAHNFHIQHRARVTTDADTSDSSPSTMGMWTARRHRAELYTIGLFMYRGSAAGNDGKPYSVARMPAGGLESILHAAPWRYSYVDLSRATSGSGTSWMFQRIPSMSWGTQNDPLVPRDEYDGLLFIDTVHPPTYVRAIRP